MDGITIMPLVPVDFLDCEDADLPPPPAIGSANPLVRGLTYAVHRVSRTLVRALTPKNLYAIDRGGGGDEDFISPFNAVDPLELRDDPDVDFVGVWNGTVSSAGRSTQPATLIVTSQDGGVVAGEFRIAEPGATQAYNDGGLRFFTGGEAESSTLTFVLSEGGISGTFSLQR